MAALQDGRMKKHLVLSGVSSALLAVILAGCQPDPASVSSVTAVDDGEAAARWRWRPSPTPSPTASPSVSPTPSPSPTASASPDYVLYVSPQGNDASDGTQPTQAIRTLARAQQLLTQVNPAKNVRVLIEAGRYYAQKVTWTWVRPQYSVTFASASATDKPVFDGCSTAVSTYPSTLCAGGTWFTLNYKLGAASNIRFENLRIQNYQMAITFNGDRDSLTTYNRLNSVENCEFFQIGNVFNPNLAYATAAIRLYASKQNTLRNNRFEKIVNVSPYAGYIHAIYAAHYAGGNTITGNQFIDISGDAIRIRDASNGSVINGNSFTRTGITAAYTDWFCSTAERTDCTKVTPECPSWNNEFRNNTISGGNFVGSALKTYELFQGDEAPGCVAPSATSVRIIL